MRRAPLRLGALSALVFACLLIPLCAHGQDTDFSDTTDILNGQRRMLRADDLALVYQDPAQQAPYTNAVYTDLFLTQNSLITQGEFMTATATGAAALPNAQVQVVMGRMFDQATDVVAVAAQEADPSNPSSFALYVTVYDRADSRSQRVLVMAAQDDLTPTSVLMADFTGDGYDDLAVSFSVVDGFTAVVTAADPANWAAGFVVGPLYYTQPIQNASFADMAAADVEGDGSWRSWGRSSPTPPAPAQHWSS